MGRDSRVRVGVDVGGTFTHAVALDALDLTVVGKVRVPTTHRAEEGVARGIVEALALLLRDGAIEPEAIVFLAHSTTQATNALLEGDVARVAVLCVGQGLEGRKARSDTDLGRLELPSRTVEILHDYLELTGADLAPEARERVASLRDRGAEVLVAAEPFSVENPEREDLLTDLARASGLLATGTHEVSGLYGLRARTRTSAVNASILPKMMAAAQATERAIREQGIAAPLMIVRSDGGVMSVGEVARRPIMTLLSGPAAGVAAAVTHIGLSDGVFLEVGGTSTDISAIVDGRPVVRTATVGGHRLHLRTLDIETIAVAGGSMPRVRQGMLAGVGPRSAHIAGLPYVSFDPVAAPDRAEVIAPLPGDPPEYLVLGDGARHWAFTLTCARRTLTGECPPEWAGLLAHAVGLDGEAFCRSMLRTAGEAAARVAEAVAERAGLTGGRRRVFGGGGGCGALLPSVAEALRTHWHECADAEVISAIGVARAVLRESVERNLPNPTQEALSALRQEALDAVLRMGADPTRVEVQMEVDQASGVARAVASGPLELDTASAGEDLSPDERLATARRVLSLEETAPVEHLGEAGGLHVYRAEVRSGGILGRFRRARSPVVVLDAKGRVRLEREDGRVVGSTVATARAALDALVDYGDHGSRLPPTQLVAGGRVTDLAGVSDPAQATQVVADELAGLGVSDPVFYIRS
jgi:N-methylhydantoinase A